MNKKPRATREKKEVSGSGTNRAQAPGKEFRLTGPGKYQSEKGPIVEIHSPLKGLYFNANPEEDGTWEEDGSPSFPDGFTAESYGRLIRCIKSPKGSAQAKPKPSQSHPQPRRPKK